MAERAWTCKDALDWTADYLARKGDDHPRRSAEWLLSAATGLSRVQLYAFHDRPLSPEERVSFRSAIERRASGEPLQYVTGEMPFRHLVLRVKRGVFIPRPETEVLVDAALEAISSLDQPLVIDLCTGSGAVAVSLAYEHSSARVLATDVSEHAVEAARQNSLYAGVDERVQLFHGSLFEPVSREYLGRMDVVVSNPPYIPTEDVRSLPEEVLAYEPMAALDGGADGLDVARKIASEALEWLKPGGLLAMEVDETRAQAMAEEMQDSYEGVAVRKDLTGRDRIVVGNKREARQS
ncbi:MAG: peptide chain release factor N(5)-glutamine methyltransferase [Actinobacteria bacterium HGW-Actinobacteria-6]|nr:MAG: peptide chain release factor N(5)-glutamine methyltransferase [Actinobacteria bacterium HGW-Actinobacteria-6]